MFDARCPPPSTHFRYNHVRCTHRSHAPLGTVTWVWNRLMAKHFEGEWHGGMGRRTRTPVIAPSTSRTRSTTPRPLAQPQAIGHPRMFHTPLSQPGLLAHQAVATRGSGVNVSVSGYLKCGSVMSERQPRFHISQCKLSHRVRRKSTTP